MIGKIRDLLRTLVLGNPITAELYRRYRRRQKRPDYTRAPEEIPGIYGRVHPYDFMIGGRSAEAAESYNRIAWGAYGLLAEGMARLGREADEIEAVLDFGCGYGRVTRALVQKFAAERVTVFDVDPVAVRFCAEEFGVHGLIFSSSARWRWREVRFERYDLIWAGSVFTHLSERYSAETMQLLSAILMPGGLLVFTTHGEEARNRLAQGFYGGRFQQKSGEVEERMRRKGSCFIRYLPEEMDMLPFRFVRATDFGMSWMAEGTVRRMVEQASPARMELLEFRPAGWEGHQDVYYYQRSDDDQGPKDEGKN